MKIEKLTSILTYAGAVPFIVALVLQFYQVQLFGFNGDIWFVSYGLVITSFMAGSIWGHSLLHSEKNRRALILISTNILTLIAWFCYLLGSPTASLVTNALALLGLAVIELQWSSMGTVARYYLLLRARITLLVLALHALMILIN